MDAFEPKIRRFKSSVIGVELSKYGLEADTDMFAVNVKKKP